MTLPEFAPAGLLYPAIRWLHIGAVCVSGALFAVRAAAINLASATWPMARPVRLTSYAIDTVLLAAALTLAVLIGQYPFVDAWLTTKVGLLMIYIVLGSLGLKRARDRRVRILCCVAAGLVFGAIVAVARAHDPLGPFARH